ncbi:MAG: MarR family transcriptional regulator [Halioglobus sp.]
MATAEHRSLLLGQYMPYQMVNLAKRVSDACNTKYGEPFGISIAEWRVLAQLGQHAETTSQGLGEITFMDKSRVSRALKQLEDKKYLSRRADPDDNRASFLSLTSEGQQLYAKLVPLALAWEAEFLSALDITEYRDLLSILSKLENQLGKMEGDVAGDNSMGTRHGH